ncbi:MAG: hypothetical protein HZA66_10885 [Rhodopseudomonas palustris]|uniref:Uncharacterized protein n=1 Tax=Rhodopseudomonas palustris TaxID=1076 RepID=A0A933VVJ9_RHOPL|nr:hypothetical protein [Rhodopseudomonas palustris]
MRKILIAALFAAAAPVTGHAAPLMAPAAQMQAAVAEASGVDTVACVRRGWRGPGVYPGCGYHRPYYRPYPYVVAPVYVGPRVVVAAPVPAPRQCWIAGAWRPC